MRSISYCKRKIRRFTSLIHSPLLPLWHFRMDESLPSLAWPSWPLCNIVGFFIHHSFAVLTLLFYVLCFQNNHSYVQIWITAISILHGVTRKYIRLDAGSSFILSRRRIWSRTWWSSILTASANIQSEPLMRGNEVWCYYAVCTIFIFMQFPCSSNPSTLSALPRCFFEKTRAPDPPSPPLL